MSAATVLRQQSSLSRQQSVVSQHDHRKHSNPERSTEPSQASSTKTSTTDANKSPEQLLVKRLIQNHVFEFAMAIIIVFNFVMIIIEADATVEQPDGEIPDAPGWVEAGGWLILILFVVELILRIYVDRWQFFEDDWNNFDFFIISIDATCSLLGLVLGSAIPVSALRILRLCKLARMSKIFRVFPELRLMLAGLVGCMRSIFWGMILLIFTLLVWAIMGVAFIHPLNLKIAETGMYQDTNCERCPRAYDSVAHALVTLLQQAVAGDSWGIMTIPIIEEYPASAVFFVGVMMTVTIAVLNLILGVVVNVAMESRDNLAAQIAKDKFIRRVEVQTNLSQVCSDMDKDDSGELSKDEFMSGYQENEEFRNTLNELDIDEDDLEILWTILDPDKDGQVPYSTFIHRSYSMKESDTQFMLAYIKYYVTKIRNQILQGQEDLREFVMKSQNRLEHQIEEFEHQIEDEMQYDFTGKPVDQSNIQLESVKEYLGSKRPGDTASHTVKKGSDVSLNFSEDNQKLLYDIWEASRKWQDELATSLNGFKVRLDSIVKDAVWTPLPQQPMSARLAVRPAHSPIGNGLRYCQHEMSQPGITSVMESVVGQSVLSTDDVVELVKNAQQPDSVGETLV